MAYEHDRESGAAHVTVPEGRGYRVDSPASNALVTRELADELRRVLERFAADAGFSDENPVRVLFRPGMFGHHRVGRAADIYAVQNTGLDLWKMRWDAAMARARHSKHVHARAAIVRAEQRRNLGWRLYKSLQCYGRWSKPYGYPIQLFGPWTRSEGPWKCISDRLLRAHADHIHVAR
jgi:hypothetical protein